MDMTTCTYSPPAEAGGVRLFLLFLTLVDNLTVLLRDFLVERVVIPLALRAGVYERLDYPTLVGASGAGDCCFLHDSHLALVKCYFLPFLSSEIRFFQSAEIPLPERTAEVISLITL